MGGVGAVEAINRLGNRWVVGVCGAVDPPPVLDRPSSDRRSDVTGRSHRRCRGGGSIGAVWSGRTRPQRSDEANPVLRPLRRPPSPQEMAFFSGGESFWNERTPEENARSKPPPFDSVRMPGLWMVDLFTPSTVRDLHAALGDIAEERSRQGTIDIHDWIVSSRRGLGISYTTLPSLVDARDWHRYAPTVERVALPSGVRMITPGVANLTPSISAIVLTCWFDPAEATRVDSLWRADYQHHNEPSGGYFRRFPGGRTHPDLSHGYSIHTADEMRRRAIERALAEVRQSCRHWAADRFGGLFADTLSQPVVELMVTSITPPYSSDFEWSLDALGIGRAFPLWRDGPWTLAEPRSIHRAEHQAEHRAILSIRRADYNGVGDSDKYSDRSIFNHASFTTQDLLTRWALSLAINEYDSRVSRIRDTLSRGSRIYWSASELRRLRNHLLSESIDARSLITDLRRATKSAWTYGTASNFKATIDGKEYEFMEELRLGQRNAVKDLDQRLRVADGTLQAATSVTGALSNTRTQRLVVFLAIVSVVVALLALARSGDSGDRTYKPTGQVNSSK